MPHVRIFIFSIGAQQARIVAWYVCLDARVGIRSPALRLRCSAPFPRHIEKIYDRVAQLADMAGSTPLY